MCRATASPSEQVSSVPDRVGQETSIPSISGAIECDSSRTTGSNATCGAVALFERSRLPKSLYVRCELLSSKAALLNGMTNTENNPQNGSRERAVVYVRVSSKKQAEEGVSIAAQTEKGKAYATIMEFAVSDEDVFVDDGVSASIHLWDRPAGKALKSHIHAEGIRHIIAVKIDRLFRDVPDLLTTVDELRKEEIDLHLLEYNGATLDTSSAMGRFFLTVIGGIAELELGQVSERTKFAIEYKKSNCQAFTGAIYGWDRDGDDLTPNWHEQSFIDYMRDLYFGHGMSAYWIAKELNDYGETGKLGGKWRSSNVLRTIRYEFHEEREKFEKPEWWKKAPFHDTVPWGTTDFLDLYPQKL